MTDIFSEDSLAPNRIEPQVDNNEMVIEDAAWEKAGSSPTEDVGLRGQDIRTRMTQ